jgi:hypothetical protein
MIGSGLVLRFGFPSALADGPGSFIYGGKRR